VTDAYPTAFARAASCRLVTFDTGCAHFGDLDFLLLEP
jgi:hypothetical protein